MTDFSVVEKNLTAYGFTVKTFATAADAAAYLNEVIDGESVGIGGSATVRDSGVYDLLTSHNHVYWHWIQLPNAARAAAMDTEVYLTSANAVAETGEIVNMDGLGNRVASTLFGHKRLYIMVGRNKIVPTYEDAVWRVRNVAAPKRAQQVGAQTPCAATGDRCFDCRSPGRVCRGLVTLYGPTMGMDAEVLLIDEDLGL